MNRTPDEVFDYRIAEWLDNGPNQGPRFALASVLTTFPTVSQRRRWLLPGIPRPTTSSGRLVWMAIGALLALALVGSLIAGAALLRSALVKPLPHNGAIVGNVFGELDQIDPQSGEVSATIGRGAYIDLSWAPDGRRLAVARDDGVWIRDVAPIGSVPSVTSEKKIVDCSAYTSGCTVGWSPNGDRIAVAFDTADARGGTIELMDPEGGDVKRLIQIDGSIRLPTWSPDGRQLAYVVTASDADPALNGLQYLYAINADGTQIRSIAGPFAADEARFFDLAWSPRRNQIAWLDQDPRLAVRILSLGTGETTQVDFGDCCAGLGPGLAWSPDGELLAVDIAQGASVRGLFVMHPDGSELTPLVEDGVTGRIGWQPIPP